MSFLLDKHQKLLNFKDSTHIIKLRNSKASHFIGKTQQIFEIISSLRKKFDFVPIFQKLFLRLTKNSIIFTIKVENSTSLSKSLVRQKSRSPTFFEVFNFFLQNVQKSDIFSHQNSGFV